MLHPKIIEVLVNNWPVDVIEKGKRIFGSKSTSRNEMQNNLLPSFHRIESHYSSMLSAINLMKIGIVIFGLVFLSSTDGKVIYSLG